MLLWISTRPRSRPSWWTTRAGLTRRLRFPTTREAIIAFAQRNLSPEYSVAMEATLNTWAVVDLIRPFVGSVRVSNPLLTRAIAQAKIKTDKIDALVLAHLLRLGYLPEVWTPMPKPASCACRPPSAVASPPAAPV